LVLALLAAAALPVAVAPPAAADPAPFPLGQTSLQGSAAPCAKIPGHTCQSFKVVGCPNVSMDISGEFSVSPAPNPQRGALVIFTPGKGVGFWADLPDPTKPTPRWNYLTFAIDQGFQVLQVSWSTPWRDSLLGEVPPVGPARLACRPATIARYLYDQYWAPLDRPRVPGVCGFCMQGGSGAASQIAYPLTHYGADAYLDAILPVSGPTHSAMAKTCGRVRGQFDYWGSAQNDFDSAYGFTTDTGPCAQHDPSWVPLWDRDSVATQGSDYHYPSTRVYILLGKNDAVQVTNVSDYVSKLAANGSPFVEVNIIPDMDHALNADGYDALEDALTWEASHGMHACDNGLDDDLDGFVDFAGGDPGCTAPAGPADVSERDPAGAACDDGVDNDGDGRTDSPDDLSGCSDPLDNDERSATAACDDDVDNDGDGAWDFPADLGCVNPNDSTPGAAPEREAGYPCDDHVDNDGDGATDFPADTPDCASAAAYGEGVPASYPSLSVASVSRSEGTGANGLAVLSFTLSAAPQREVRVGFTTGGGSATADGDYASRAGTVVWEAGSQTLQQVGIIVIGDGLVEPSEDLTVTLSSPVNVTLASGSAQVTILDDDDAPAGATIAAGSAGTTEKDPGQTNPKCDLKATLSASPTGAVSVAYATTSAGATATAGADYTARTGTVSWPAGATKLAKTISVTVLADDLAEGTETFFLDLSNPNPANIGLQPSRATCTITDDDGGSGGLNVAAVNASTTEADPGQTNARCNLKATLSATPSVTVTVSYATTSVGATAVAGTDYTAKSGTVSWAAGTTNLSKTIAVPVLSDAVPEGTETFFLDLSSPSPTTTTIAPSRATCTILDDD
jgi:hypothetical protein